MPFTYEFVHKINIFILKYRYSFDDRGERVLLKFRRLIWDKIHCNDLKKYVNTKKPQGIEQIIELYTYLLPVRLDTTRQGLRFSSYFTVKKIARP